MRTHAHSIVREVHDQLIGEIEIGGIQVLPPSNQIIKQQQLPNKTIAVRCTGAQCVNTNRTIVVFVLKFDVTHLREFFRFAVNARLSFSIVRQPIPARRNRSSIVFKCVYTPREIIITFRRCCSTVDFIIHAFCFRSACSGRRHSPYARTLVNRMNYLGKFISNFRHVYNEINPATLTGAIDIVVVEQPDGTFTCSPFHVRFGKIGVLRSREKIVSSTCTDLFSKHLKKSLTFLPYLFY